MADGIASSYDREGIEHIAGLANARNIAVARE